MEAQRQSSRKRKQPSSSSSVAAAAGNSNPFAGILTRHKSQKFFFHHNRSGKSRRSRTFPSSLTNPKLPTTNQRSPDCKLHDVVIRDGDDGSVYHVSIKDLRARRVFSEPFGFESVGKIRDDGFGKSVNPNSDSELIVGKLVECDVKSDGNGVFGGNASFSVMGICDSGVESKGGDSDGRNPNLVMSKNGNDSGVELKVDSNGGNPNLSILEKCVDVRVDFVGECINGGNPNFSIEGIGAKDDLGGLVSNDMSPNLSSKVLEGRNGEHYEVDVQTTPPDAVVLIRQSEDQSVLQSRSADSRSTPKKISPSKGGSAQGKKGFPTSRRNLGLNPCSRLKVFTPNSFSYRRLLPFLMDLGKNTPSKPKVSPSIKIETGVEEKPLVSSAQESVVDRLKLDEKQLATPVACEAQEMNAEGKEEASLSLNPKSSDSKPQQAAPCTPVNFPIEKSQENPASDESLIGTPVTDDLKSGGASLHRQVSLDSLGNSEDISPIVEPDLAATMHNPKRSSEPSREDDAVNAPSHLSLSSEKECRTGHIDSKSDESLISVLNSSSKLEAVVSPVVPGFGLAKGILMRNPRGCRGICNCLTCASFRLNAEKAFEFSRNQLLDVEELAMDLMKEMSNMRFMLEKSVNGTDHSAVVPVDQVQEVCRRASHAEDTARSRLKQMNEDLHNHCRTKPLQRPRVNFSSFVQEKI